MIEYALDVHFQESIHTSFTESSDSLKMIVRGEASYFNCGCKHWHPRLWRAHACVRRAERKEKGASSDSNR